MLLSLGTFSNAAADEGRLPNGLLASAEGMPIRTLSEPAGAENTVSEAEAKMWVLNAGYDQVSGLERDEDSFYVGTALLDGSTYAVVVDAAGNVLGLKE